MPNLYFLPVTHTYSLFAIHIGTYYYFYYNIILSLEPKNNRTCLFLNIFRYLLHLCILVIPSIFQWVPGPGKDKLFYSVLLWHIKLRALQRLNMKIMIYYQCFRKCLLTWVFWPQAGFQGKCHYYAIQDKDSRVVLTPVC